MGVSFFPLLHAKLKRSFCLEKTSRDLVLDLHINPSTIDQNISQHFRNDVLISCFFSTFTRQFDSACLKLACYGDSPSFAKNNINIKITVKNSDCFSTCKNAEKPGSSNMQIQQILWFGSVKNFWENETSEKVVTFSCYPALNENSYAFTVLDRSCQLERIFRKYISILSKKIRCSIYTTGWLKQQFILP